MFWKKWENLLWLKDNISKIQDELNKQSNIKIKLNVPEFELISNEVFDRHFKYEWTELDFVETELNDYAQYVNQLTKKYFNKEIAIRSSAINSEDWDLTWAWIYTSVIITKSELENNTWEIRLSNNKNDKVFYKSPDYNEIFRIWLYVVYKSIVSDKAIEYRKSNNVPNETMAIIIQDFVNRDHIWYGDYDYYNTKFQWYAQIDSILKNNPNYLRLIWGDDGVMIIKRDEIDNSFFREINEIFNDKKNYTYGHTINDISNGLFPYDLYKMPPMIGIVLMKIWYELEKLYWKEVQIELAFKSSNFRNVMKTLDWRDEKTSDNILELEIDFFQIRKLPENYKVKKEVEFPNKEILFEWYCFSVWDYTLENFNNKMYKQNTSIYDLRKENCAYVTDSSYGASEWVILPKSWAVIILNSVWISFWHIETICAEEDILCVFSKKWVDDWESSNFRNRRDENKNWDNTEDVYKLLREKEKLRIVSDWFIGRIYEA